MTRLSLNLGDSISQPGSGDGVSQPGFQELLLGDGSEADQQELTTFGGDFGGGFNENDAQRNDPRFESILPTLSLGQGLSQPGGGQVGGSASSSTSQSSSVPGVLAPDAGEIRQDFGQLQGGIGINDPQSQAIAQQQNLSDTTRGLLQGAGAGQRARINDQFDTAANNAAGVFNSRGFAGSSLNINAQQQVEGGRQSALTGLQDQLLGQKTDSEIANATSISDLLFGSANQATDLLGGILGSSGIGNFGSSQDVSASRSRQNDVAPGFSFGGSDSGPDSLSQNPLDAARREQEAQRQRGGASGGIASGGGGGGGGGGQQGGGGSQTINNPFVPASPAFANDPTGQSEAGVPLEEQELEEDDGPLETPGEFNRNFERLKAREAAANANGSGAPTNALAQSAGGTAAAIAAGGSLA